MATAVARRPYSASPAAKRQEKKINSLEKRITNIRRRENETNQIVMDMGGRLAGALAWGFFLSDRDFKGFALGWAGILLAPLQFADDSAARGIGAIGEGVFLCTLGDAARSFRD